jgi:hypothetical protein
MEKLPAADLSAECHQPASLPVGELSHREAVYSNDA